MENLIMENLWVVVVLVIWSIPWKGVALWKSARRGHMAWFIIFFFVNTLAILEIIYLLTYRDRKGDDEGQEDEPKRERTKVITTKIV